MTARARTPAGGTGEPRVHLVRGSDASLVGQAVTDLVRALVGDRDASTVVEEHGSSGTDDLEAGAVADGLSTPPMLSDRRVVVLRDAGRLSAGDAARIVSCLEDPAPGVFLVLAAGGGTVPAVLTKTVESLGKVIDTAVGTGRARSQWMTEHLRGAPVRIDARAAGLLSEHLGNDVSRLRGLLDALASAYGEGASVDLDQLEPFLGEPGAVAPWELTDSIDAGETAAALHALGRIMGAGGYHPLAVLAMLHRHYQAMLRLDGAGITSGEEAAAVLGTRSAFPARKALEQGRRLGSARLGRAVVLLAEADLDLRGRSAMPGEVVLEVLVGRLSRLLSARERSATASGAHRAGARHR